ncbi:MAG: ribonuclease HII [Clostridia bacterium]|nr:ribonuclease HII [Clostridia bacterium]
MDCFEFEKQAFADGYSVICGVDEAGKGPLAGPVYAAAVILPLECAIEGLDDSKKISEKKREALFDIIIEKAVAYCVASASVEEIEKFNILNATFIAMRRAVDGLKIRPDLALVDGNRAPSLECDVRTIVKGDSKSASISAASILAKVSRDRYMLELDKKVPQYCFAKHKGYGTKLHYEKIREFGVSEYHRPSFLKTMKW